MVGFWEWAVKKLIEEQAQQQEAEPLTLQLEIPELTPPSTSPLPSKDEDDGEVSRGVTVIDLF
jgi:hypothetical protein